MFISLIHLYINMKIIENLDVMDLKYFKREISET